MGAFSNANLFLFMGLRSWTLVINVIHFLVDVIRHVQMRIYASMRKEAQTTRRHINSCQTLNFLSSSLPFRPAVPLL